MRNTTFFLHKPKHTIRFTVVSIFVFAVLLTATVALSLQYYFTKSIAEASTEQVFNLRSQVTSQYLASIDDKAERIVEYLSNFKPITDSISFDENISPALVTVLNDHPTFYSLYLGFPNGDLHQIINLDATPTARKQLKANHLDRWVVINITGVGEARTRTFSYLNEELVLRVVREEKTDFDSAKRPWYFNAKARVVTKTGPYMFQYLKEAGRTYSIPLNNNNVVLAIDIPMSTLSNYLGEHGMNKAGIKDRDVYLFQKTGKVLTSNRTLDSDTLIELQPKITLSANEKKLITQAPILKVSNEMNWAPIDFAVAGQPQGYSVETIKLISKMTGLKFEFINGFTWPELLLGYAKKDIDILQPVFKTRYNDVLGEYSLPILSLPFALITTVDQPTFQSMAELAGKSLGIPKGWSVIAEVRHQFPKINIVEVESTKALIQAVAKGEVDAGLDNEAILKFTQDQLFVEALRYQTELKFLLSLNSDLHLVLSKKAQPYAGIINKALTQYALTAKAVLAQKWLSTTDDESSIGTLPHKILLDIAQDETRHNYLTPFDLDGIEHYVLVSPIDREKNEFFATVIPVEVVLADTIEKIQLSMLLTSICLLMTLPASWFFSGPIVRPIKLLAQEHEKVAKRQYDDVQLIDSNIKEIDFLARTFVQMTASIEQYENSQKELMEAYIKLIAQAIDDKSHYTAQHCNRVPELGLMLAEEASNSTQSAFAHFCFETKDQHREFRIAAWLHDCGKITTPEHIVDKGSKLETIYNRIHEVRMRFEVLWRDAELNYYQKLIAQPDNEAALKAELALSQQQLQDDFSFIAASNVGGEFMDEKNVERLKTLATKTWQRYFDDRLGLSPFEELRMSKNSLDLPATEQLLSDKPEHIIKREHPPQYDPSLGIKMAVPEHLYNLGELYNLSIRAGTLTSEDRFKINEHVISTIKMLDTLPFPPELANVPKYASTHHETLTGTGYPRKLTAEDLSVPERVLVIADIFEALTAGDRPYKKAKPLSVSVDILYKFAVKNHIDIDLFELFLTSGIYLKYAQQHLQPDQIDEVDISQYLRKS